MEERKFYVCEHCGNLLGLINDGGVTPVCCGEPMRLLTANSVDASAEKHVPVTEVSGDTVRVRVGSAAHPMLPEHYIQWIFLQTEHGGQRKALKPESAPEAVFALKDDRAVAAYAYCNLHGLWKKEL